MTLSVMRMASSFAVTCDQAGDGVGSLEPVLAVGGGHVLGGLADCPVFDDLERQLMVERLGAQAGLAEDYDGGVDGDGGAGFLDPPARQPVVLPLQDAFKSLGELGFAHLAKLVALEVAMQRSRQPWQDDVHQLSGHGASPRWCRS